MTFSIEKNRNNLLEGEGQISGHSKYGFQKSPSPRIETILNHCQKGWITYDLCCDQGKIGILALAQGITSEVIFVDRLSHLVESIEKKLSPFLNYDNEKSVAFKVEDILEMQPNNHVQANFIIAGVGMDLCLQALKKLSLQVPDGSRFICQVNRSVTQLPSQVENSNLPLKLLRSDTAFSSKRKFMVHTFQKSKVGS